ncbi:MAG: hypothetical protein AB7V50_00705 [Vampirovibrionia bacterium]
MGSYTKKYEDFPEGLINWLETISEETSCSIDKTEWQNKFDEKICYTHRPENPEEYEITVTVSSESKHNIDFINYLIENKIKAINYLKNCFTD